MREKEIQNLKDQIYKDSKLLGTLFNNISFNLYECTDNQEEKNNIIKAKRIIEESMISNMTKITRLNAVDKEDLKHKPQEADLSDIAKSDEAQDSKNPAKK